MIIPLIQMDSLSSLSVAPLQQSHGTSTLKFSSKPMNLACTAFKARKSTKVSIHVGSVDPPSRQQRCRIMILRQSKSSSMAPTMVQGFTAVVRLTRGMFGGKINPKLLELTQLLCQQWWITQFSTLFWHGFTARCQPQVSQKASSHQNQQAIRILQRLRGFFNAVGSGARSCQ